MIYRKLALTGGLIVSLLSGCVGLKPEEELYTAFEQAIEKEKMLSTDIEKLKSLEKEGQELYNTIIKQGQENNKGIAKKTDKAILAIGEREKILKREKDLLETVKNEIDDSFKLVDEINKEDLKKQAKKVVELYTNRYNSSTGINGNYQKIISSEKKLYSKLASKDTDLKEIIKETKEINQIYEKIQLEKEKFNNFTKEYNKEKVAFYKSANIHIKEDKK